MAVKKSFGILLAGALVFGGCAVETNNPTDTGSTPKANSVEDLELTSDDLSAWVNREATLVEGSVDGFVTFDNVEDLANNAINGGAYQYNHEDITRASIQLMMRETSGGKTYLAEIRIFNMSTNEKAKQNLDDYTSEKTPEPFNDLGYAKYTDGATSCVAYAAYDKFYIELTLSGYSTGDDAVTDARSFLRLFKKKTHA